MIEVKELIGTRELIIISAFLLFEFVAYSGMLFMKTGIFGFLISQIPISYAIWKVTRYKPEKISMKQMRRA